MKNNEKISISSIDINSLKFDPENPRLPDNIKGSSIKKTVDWMLLDAALVELVSSIAQNGFFQGEPLLVIEDGKNFVVVEGNRRLAACLILNNPGISKTKSNTIREILHETDPENIPSSIPCIIFKKRDDIVNYLGYRHITGVQSWGPLSKSRYLNLLFSKLGRKGDLTDKCTLLAKKIGSKGSHVKKLLVGYWLYEILVEEGFYGIKGLEDDKIEFSRLYGSLDFSNIKKFLNIDLDDNRPDRKVNKKHFEEFCFWVYERTEGTTRLGDNRNLRVLDRVVESKDALKAFRSGKSLHEAGQYSDAPDERFSACIEKSLSNIREAVTIAGRTKSFHDSDFENIQQIMKFSKILSDAARNQDF